MTDPQPQTPQQPTQEPLNLVDQAENLLNDESTGKPGEPGADSGKAPTDGDTDRGAAGDSDKPAGEGGAKGGSEGDPGGDKGTEGAAEDTGYVADEGDEDEDEAPVDKTGKEPSSLSPDLQYVVDNLPTLQTRGKDGKTYQVKAAGQLPDDFEFATKKDELLFNQALAGQELKAQQLQAQYNQNQQNQAANDFSEKENKDIRRDIGALQREGKLGKFQYAPDDPKFNDDPAVKDAQKVIDFMNEANAKYLEAANKGGVLYHLSFRDAYNLMPKDAPTNTAQQQEDKQRKQVARQTAGAASSAPTQQRTPTYYGVDLKDMVDQMEL
jgi:hypothetical protein